MMVSNADASVSGTSDADRDGGFLVVVAYIGGPLDGQSATRLVRDDSDQTLEAADRGYNVMARSFDDHEHELEQRAIAATGAQNVYDFRVLHWPEEGSGDQSEA